MEMEKKNLAIIVLAIALVASGVGNLLFAIPLWLKPIPPVGQDIVSGTISGLVHMDPQYAYDTASSQIIENVCEPFYVVNWSDPAYPTIPRLATAMPNITNGGLTYTITLQEGVTFHDGTQFNATTAKWTLDMHTL